ncbi:hypothetical protein EP232_01785 [bacterium]|nr:MAG: hypothetical protein EP232_01785 [bacterium]
MVFLNFPLRNHQFARQSAAAALASGKQGLFWEFHDNLFENFNRLNEEKITSIAADLNLNMERFNRDRANPELANLINRDLQQGQMAGVRGTPTIFINGKLLSNRSLEGFSQAIERELRSN